MREIIAALLRSRGWEHDDATDPADMFWRHQRVGVRPILVAVADEMNQDHAGEGPIFVFVEPYTVQTAYRAPISLD